MPRTTVAAWLTLALLAAPVAAASDAAPIRIPLERTHAATYNVAVELGQGFRGDFLVDTGSSHMAIRESTLRRLQQAGHARFVKNLAGRMADGSRQVVPVYRIDRVRIGEQCVLERVDAAIFPDSARPILGMGALRQAAPIGFSTEPPVLKLGGCDDLHAAAR